MIEIKSTASENMVLDRINNGDELLLDSSYSLKSVFSDGTCVAHQVMLRLSDSGVLKEPSARGLSWCVSGASF